MKIFRDIGHGKTGILTSTSSALFGIDVRILKIRAGHCNSRTKPYKIIPLAITLSLV